MAVGGVLPLTFSLLGDLYPPTKRTAVSGWIGVGMGIGIGTGQNLAGMLGPPFGWRVPFFVAACPAIVVGILIFCFTEEPKRGSMDHDPRDGELA